MGSRSLYSTLLIIIPYGVTEFILLVTPHYTVRGHGVYTACYSSLYRTGSWSLYCLLLLIIPYGVMEFMLHVTHHYIIRVMEFSPWLAGLLYWSSGVN